MKQTSVEWLVEQLEINNYISKNAHWLIDDAKEVEKQQEKSYSEEDMEIAFGTISTNWICFKEFIEQFKNK